MSGAPQAAHGHTCTLPLLPPPQHGVQTSGLLFLHFLSPLVDTLNEHFAHARGSMASLWLARWPNGEVVLARADTEDEIRMVSGLGVKQVLSGRHMRGQPAAATTAPVAVHMVDSRPPSSAAADA